MKLTVLFHLVCVAVYLHANVINNPEEGINLEGDILGSTFKDGLVSNDSFWKNGIVPYKFQSGYPAIEKIKEIMDEFHKYTCIKFKETNEDDRDYIFIRNPQPIHECSSFIGRQGGEQMINLSVDGCTKFAGTIIHELMHVLGIVHEQSRSDRNHYIKVLWDNVKPGFEHNFRLPYQKTFSYGIPYNPKSVMHYSFNAFSTNRNLPTIQIIDKTIDSKDVGQRRYFACMDVIKINRIYGCKEHYAIICPHVAGKTLNKASTDSLLDMRRRLCVLWNVCKT